MPNAPTPDPAPSRNPGSTQSIPRRAHQRTTWSRKNSLHDRGVIKHLKAVDQANTGKLQRSAHLTVKKWNKSRGTHWVECILFGEEDYFIGGDVAKAPQEGWRIVVLDRDKDNKDFDGNYSNDEYDTNES